MIYVLALGLESLTANNRKNYLWRPDTKRTLQRWRSVFKTLKEISDHDFLV